jgi:hypothetical protein
MSLDNVKGSACLLFRETLLYLCLAKKKYMKIAFILLATFGLTIKQTPSVKVAKIQGVDVYVYSTPEINYRVVDSGKVRITLTGGCNEVVNVAVKKASQAGADGVIVDLASSGLGNAWEAIKYE